MSLPGPEDVMGGLRTRWGVSAANDLIPIERVYQGRTAERTELPRARVTIEELSKEHYGPKSLVKFSITVEVYVIDTSAGQSRSAVEAVMNWTSADDFGWPMARGDMTWCRPASGGKTEPTGPRVEGKDVVKITSKWICLTSGWRITNA